MDLVLIDMREHKLVNVQSTRHLENGERKSAQQWKGSLATNYARLPHQSPALANKQSAFGCAEVICLSEGRAIFADHLKFKKGDTVNVATNKAIKNGWSHRLNSPRMEGRDCVCD